LHTHKNIYDSEEKLLYLLAGVVSDNMNVNMIGFGCFYRMPFPLIWPFLLLVFDSHRQKVFHKIQLKQAEIIFFSQSTPFLKQLFCQKFIRKFFIRSKIHDSNNLSRILGHMT
jgi:hypothetical protein